MPHEKTPLLGAHMSIAGGLYRAILEGTRIGCTAIQIFTKNNRQWSMDLLGEAEVEKFKEAWKESPIRSIISHAPYLINLASEKDDVRERSVQGLVAELRRCAQLGITSVVLHPGSRGSRPEKEALGSIAHHLDQALALVPGVNIALETMAGQGSSLGTTFEELAGIIALSSHPERLNVCLDTCHIHAAGYRVDSLAAYDELWNQFDELLGHQRLVVLHLNDSKKGCGSRVDRHTHITEGTIARVFFERIMNDPRLANIPKILETPKEADLTDDIRNLGTLKNMIVE